MYLKFSSNMLRLMLVDAHLSAAVLNGHSDHRNLTDESNPSILCALDQFGLACDDLSVQLLHAFGAAYPKLHRWNVPLFLQH
jgi:hypothetical protein